MLHIAQCDCLPSYPLSFLSAEGSCSASQIFRIEKAKLVLVDGYSSWSMAVVTRILCINSLSLDIPDTSLQAQKWLSVVPVILVKFFSDVQAPADT